METGDDPTPEQIAEMRAKWRSECGSVQAALRAREALAWFEDAAVGHTIRLYDEGEAESLLRQAEREITAALAALEEEKQRPASQNSGF